MNEKRRWILSLVFALAALANDFIPYNLVYHNLIPKDGIFYVLIWWGPVDYAHRGWFITLVLAIISLILSFRLQDRFKKVIVMTLSFLAIFSGISWLGSLR
jgi:hypothetical protein